VADVRWVPRNEMAAVVDAEDDREYSLNKVKSFARIPGNKEGQPFVPKASWSFQMIEEDTLHPEEKLARIQVQTQREIALHMQKLQLDLLAQLEAIKARQATLQASDIQDGLEGLKQQQTLIEQQLQLQRQYLQKVDELQKKARKMHRVLTIVYI
ncbi:MAG: hypothetical protein JST68_12990, partial [Bacteroidetes bacterium]|nr:hypothetical protein [Bacteroidota bacterium]